MIGIFQYVMFIWFCIYAFTKALSYGIYEIKQEKNKFGGIAIIVFSLLSCSLALFALTIA